MIDIGALLDEEACLARSPLAKTLRNNEYSHSSSNTLGSLDSGTLAKSNFVISRFAFSNRDSEASRGIYDEIRIGHAISHSIVFSRHRRQTSLIEKYFHDVHLLQLDRKFQIVVTGRQAVVEQPLQQFLVAAETGQLQCPLTGKGYALRHAKVVRVRILVHANMQRLGVFRFFARLGRGQHPAFVAHLLDPFEVSQLDRCQNGIIFPGSSNCCYRESCSDAFPCVPMRSGSRLKYRPGWRRCMLKTVR